MDGFCVLGFTSNQSCALLKKFKPYLSLGKGKLLSSLKGIEGLTLYECLMFWVRSRKQWNNIIINVNEDDITQTNELKKQKFLQETQLCHESEISRFVLNQKIIFFGNKWYISLKKNGYYRIFTKAKDMLSRLNYSREKLIEPSYVNNWLKKHIELLKIHFEVNEEPVENCMVFGDGEIFFFENRKTIFGKKEPAFCLSNDYLNYSFKIIKHCYPSGMYPLWVNNMMKDVFPFKYDWNSNLIRKQNKMFIQDLHIAMHVLFYRLLYQRGNDMGVYVVGPTGTGKTYAYFESPQKIYPNLFIKVCSPDPNGWEEFPLHLTVYDDVKKSKTNDIRLHKFTIGEQAPRRNLPPKVIKGKTYYPIIIDNELIDFQKKNYLASRRLLPIFKKTQHEKITVYDSTISRVLYFLAAEEKSKLLKNITLTDIETYKNSPLLQQRYEAMQDIKLFHSLKISPEYKATNEYYFYAWIIINTKKATNQGIDYNELCKVYCKNCELDVNILNNVFKMNICKRAVTHKHAAVYNIDDKSGEIKLILPHRTTILYE